jgi:hypothetical protein
MIVRLALLIFLSSFFAYAEDAAGHYVLRGVMEVGSELLLKPDGSFEYMLAYGAADYWAKGTWKMDGKDVVLHSTGTEEAPFRLLRSEAGKPGRIRVWVIGKNGKGVANIHVGLQAGDQHLEANTEENGAAVFPDTPKATAVFFEVRVYQLEAGPYPIDPANKDFYFEINGDSITQVFFKDEHLTPDADGLLMRHWDPDKPMHYVKE